MVENKTLKKEVNELTRALDKAYGGEDRLLMCLVAKELLSTKRDWAIPPRKARRPLLLTTLVFVKNNGRVCTSFKQIGHKEQECNNKSKNANVSSIKINSFYVLTKGTNGVKAKFIGTPWMGSKKKAIWVLKRPRFPRREIHNVVV